MIAEPPPAIIPISASENMLARAGAEMFERIETLAKHDPAAAERLYSALWAHLSQARPETPCSLSERIAPTEDVPMAAPRGEP